MDTKHTYSYDKIYRLLESLPTKLKGKDKEQGHKAEAFSYDPVGNRLVGPRTKDFYGYNAGNQLVSDREHQYQYDGNGNLIKKAELDDGKIKKTTLYSYDFENRLVRVEIQKGDKKKIVTFTYDPFGRRLSKTVHREEIEDDEDDDGEDGDDDEREVPRTIFYVYDNEDIILEFNHKGKMTARYTHGPGIDEPLAVEKKRETFYYHADGLGSVTALTDRRQRVAERYDYDSFGNLKRHGHKVKQPYTFTGREWDREIGLYYYRARYYDAMLGRFISFDPILHPANGLPKIRTCSGNISYPVFDELMQKPQKLNPFVYTEGNPINLTDPIGLASSCGSGWKRILIPDNWFGWYSFTGPCAAHDTCYGCLGATAGKSKADCDSTLLSDMFRVCATLQPNSYWRNHCEGTAYIYFNQVVTRGQSPFDAARKNCCNN